MRALLASVALLATAASGCAEPERPTVTVRARYLAPMYEGQAARVQHEAIGDWMPAMDMALSVADPALLNGLRPGDPVALRLDSTSLRIIGVDPLPEGTVLDLEPDEVPADFAFPDD